MHVLFDDYWFIWSIIWLIIWLIIWCLFITVSFDLFEIIWCLFDDYSGLIILIIWCSFDDYSFLIILIIWRLFDDCSFSFVMMIWWLFDFHASSRYVGKLHFWKPSHGTVANLGHGSLSPWVYCSLQAAEGATPHLQYYCLSLACFDLQSTLPRSACSVFLQEVATQPSRNIWR